MGLSHVVHEVDMALPVVWPDPPGMSLNGFHLLLAKRVLLRPRRLNSTARKHRGMRSTALQKNSFTVAPRADPFVTEGRRPFAETLEAVQTASLLTFANEERDTHERVYQASADP